MFTSDDPVVVMATRAATIVDELSVATANNQNSSLLPQELEVTNEVITKTLDVLFQELSENGTVNLEQVRCVVCISRHGSTFVNQNILGKSNQIKFANQ